MTQRKFLPGSEWLYMKIYTGIKTADRILEEAVIPIIQHFQKNQSISRWFFIRYSDPKPHIRLRLKLNDTDYYTDILNKINIHFQPYIDSNEISNIIMDTYCREIERYGENTMEEAEALFCINSEFTVQCLHYDDEDKIIVSLFYIDQMLDQLSLSMGEKLDWITDFNTAFKREFNADKKLNSQLDKKYREFKPEYLQFIQNEEFTEYRNFVISSVEESYLSLYNVMTHNKDQSLQMSLQNFFQSIFHMNINRLFLSNQRLFELIIYDYLLRYYKTCFYHQSAH